MRLIIARAHVRIEHSMGVLRDQLRVLRVRKCADFHENRLIYTYLSTRAVVVHVATIVAIQSDFNMSNESNYNEIKMVALLNPRINTSISDSKHGYTKDSNRCSDKARAHRAMLRQS